MSSNNIINQLSRLVYASRAERLFFLDEFMAILEKSRDKNRQSGITGVLAYGDGYFMQILEGERRAVSQTYSRITRDSRHHQIELLDFSRCSERHFADWSMQHQCVRRDILDQLQVEGAFRPHDWTAEKCIDFAIRYSALLQPPANEQQANSQTA